MQLARYEAEEVWFPFSANIFGWDREFHALMLNDRIRMDAYAAAIARVVRPGMTVLDLGTGTGILARWALEAGAATVYGIEVNQALLAEAERALRAAGHTGFQPVPGLSYDVLLPEPVDLVISEIIGNLGDNEDCLRILADARERFLKPGGLMLPQRLTTILVPVSSLQAHAQIAAGKCRVLNGHYELESLVAALGLSSRFNLYYDVIVPTSCQIACPRTVLQHDFLTSAAPSSYRYDMEFVALRDAPLTGFKGVFETMLCETIVLDIAGDDIAGGATSASWKHSYMPLETPLETRAGDLIRLSFERLADPQQVGSETTARLSCRYSWHGDIERAGQVIATFSQAMS